jgi:lipid-A-disaccharide synthase
MQSMPKPSKIRIFIIAGEASGDLFGAKLIDSLKNSAINIDISGIGGEKMIAAGMQSIFAMTDLSIMGFIEVIPSIPRIIKRLQQTQKAIENFQPHFIVTIDSPGFNFRLAKRLQKLRPNCKLIHYVAPSVWAYKPHRAAMIAKLYDHLLTILPFEKPYFDAVGLPTTYVGHPIIEGEYPQKATDENLIVIMPGSRAGEVERLGPIFKEAFYLLKQKIPLLKAFIPTTNAREEQIKTIFSGDDFVISSNPKEKQDNLSKAKSAIIKSGTSSLEIMLYNIPHLIAYKINSLTYKYLMLVVKIKYANLINLMLGREAIPELLQNQCSSGMIAKTALGLHKDEKIRTQIFADFNKARQLLGAEQQQKPSDKAAAIVLSFINQL